MGILKKIDEHVVFSVCEQLAARGEKVTVREVHNMTGGSLTGVNRWVKAWRDKAINEKVVMPERLPTTLEQAIMRELRSLIDGAIQNHVQALKNAQEGTEEVSRVLEGVEEEKNALEAKFEALQHYSHELEQQVAKLQGQTAALQQQVQSSQDWQQIATTLTAQNHDLEKQLLIYQTKYDPEPTNKIKKN